MKLDNTMRCLPKMIWLEQKTVIDVTHMNTISRKLCIIILQGI